MIKLEELLPKNLNELKVDLNNTVEVNGPPEHGDFTVGEIKYDYNFDPVPKEDLIYMGLKVDASAYNISFLPSNLDKTKISSYANLKGKQNALKVYSTMYKVINTFCKKHNPKYLVIDARDDSGYLPIYQDLVRNNPLGYTEVEGFSTTVQGKPLTGMLLKRDN